MITTAMPAPILPPPPPGLPLRRGGLTGDDTGVTEPVFKGQGQPPLTVAALFDHPAHLATLTALRPFAAAIGAAMDAAVIPASMARGGTVGRIGVPREATVLMHQQKVVLGATLGLDPLAPVARMWRGMQRRADVQVDVRQCTTLAGSAADRAGHRRDVLLFSQRLVDAPPRRHREFGLHADAAAREWTRARDAADLAYRLAAAEQRRLLLVLPVGRGTEAQQFFADALDRQARLHRMPAPRVVKAGLLTALLSGEQGSERWLVASVIPIDELSTMVREAVGDTGPWPVLGLGRDITFVDMPAEPADDPLAMLLALSSMLQRSGRSDSARILVQAALLTHTAVARMREELGGTLTVPVDAFLDGVLANWGRMVPQGTRDRRATPRDVMPAVTGLRLRLETVHSATQVRESVMTALASSGLEVASVRSSDGAAADEVFTYDVRLRSALGESVLGDLSVEAMRALLAAGLRCVAIEPWVPTSAIERPRTRAVG